MQKININFLRFVSEFDIYVNSVPVKWYEIQIWQPENYCKVKFMTWKLETSDF